MSTLNKSKYIRMLSLPPESFFLLGARGTGKSTWLSEVLPQSYVIDLLDEDLYQRLLAHPGMFAEMINEVDPSRWIVVDEIQRLPNLLNEVHRAIARMQRKFALCGSSARKLKKAGVNLLAGRALLKYMHPFVAYELAGDFQLEEILKYGSLPLIWSSIDKREKLKAYVQLYLKEEIQAEALVRNLPAFARFLPIAALFHGQVLNVSSLARDAGTHRNTIEGYLQVLEDTLLAFTLPSFELKLRVKERQHPKLYFSDPGVVRALKGQLHALTHEEMGPLFEGFVVQTLRAINDYKGIFDRMGYFAAGQSRVEVDIVLEAGGQLCAVEVKSSAELHARDLLGLKAIAEMPSVKRRIMVYTGNLTRHTEDGIEILPIGEFLNIVSRAGLL